MKIEFRKISLKDDKRTVLIIGDYKGNSIQIRMSILQLAKLFGVDKEVMKNLIFGSEELEDRCEEVKKLIKKFPYIEVKEQQLDFERYSIIDETTDIDSPEKEFVSVFVEDIVGWGNEGIRINIPKEIYDSKLEKKKYLTRVETINKKLVVGKDFIEIEEKK